MRSFQSLGLLFGFRLLEFLNCDYWRSLLEVTRDLRMLILLQNQLSIFGKYLNELLLYQQIVQFRLIAIQPIKFIYNMICSYCNPHEITIARAYNIENVHERFIPTYYHTQIFAPVEIHTKQRIRCTPTFHSQIMRTDAYNNNKRKIANHSNYKRPGSAKEVVYKNCSKGLKQDQFYNKRGNCCYRSNQLWYDSSKEDIFKKLGCCCQRNYAHERKQIDLGSNPVFGGATIDVCSSDLPDNSAPAAQIPQKTNVQEEHEQQIINSLAVQHEKPDVNPQVKPSECIKVAQNTAKEAETQTQTILNNTKKPIKKVNAFNRTVIDGRPTFTIIRKRDW